MTGPLVEVLMSTYDGERFVAQQIRADNFRLRPAPLSCSSRSRLAPDPGVGTAVAVGVGRQIHRITAWFKRFGPQ